MKKICNGVLFISRKYPPMKGGMESYSYNLISNYGGKKKAITLGKPQKNLIWFLPYACLYVLFNAKKYEVIELGDMLMSICGWIAKRVNSHITVVATVHGLDVTFPNSLYQWYLNHFSYGFEMYVPNSSYTGSIATQRGYCPIVIIPPATLNDNNTTLMPNNRKLFCGYYGISEDAFVILTAGRLVKRKGVEWFIRNVLPKCKNEKIVYFVAGDGPMKESIQTAVNDAGENRVRLLGRVTDDELRNLYTHTDVFLMPNIVVENDVEGFGMVATEACAFGRLVVAANIQGIADAVEDGTNGVLFEAGNSEELLELLIDIYENSAKYEGIKSQAREYVMNRFTGKAIASRYEELFESMRKYN